MITSPGSISVLQTRSITCWPPVVTSRSSGSTSMPSAAITSTMQSLTPSRPSVGPYWSAARRRRRADARHQRGEVLGRERARVGQAAGERDHLGPRGDRHQVAHRGGLHDLRAAGEQARVALEVARAGSRSAAMPRGFAAGPRAPWRLVYRHARLGTVAHAASSAWTSSLDLLQGIGLAAAVGVRPFLPALLAGALAARRPRHRLRRHRLRVPGVPGVPARACSRCSRSSSLIGRSRAERTSRRPLGARSPAVAWCLGALAVRRRRSPTTGTRRGPAWSPAWPARAARLRSPRATCSPASAAGSTPRPPARCPSTPRALALAAAGALDPRPARRAPRARRPRWLLIGGRRREGEKYAGLRILR